MLWLFFVPPKPEYSRHLDPPDAAAFWFLPKGAENRKAIPLFDLAILCIPPPDPGTHHSCWKQLCLSVQSRKGSQTLCDSVNFCNSQITHPPNPFIISEKMGLSRILFYFFYIICVDLWDQMGYINQVKQKRKEIKWQYRLYNPTLIQSIIQKKCC